MHYSCLPESDYKINSLNLISFFFFPPGLIPQTGWQSTRSPPRMCPPAPTLPTHRHKQRRLKLFNSSTSRYLNWRPPAESERNQKKYFIETEKENHESCNKGKITSKRLNMKSIFSSTLSHETFKGIKVKWSVKLISFLDRHSLAFFVFNGALCAMLSCTFLSPRVSRTTKTECRGKEACEAPAHTQERGMLHLQSAHAHNLRGLPAGSVCQFQRRRSPYASENIMLEIFPPFQLGNMKKLSFWEVYKSKGED